MSVGVTHNPLRTTFALAVAFSLLGLSARAQAPSLVSKMADNEVAERQQGVHYSFTSEERSARTGGHLWKEGVVETDDGPLRRLLAVDGQALSAQAANLETNRIHQLAGDPDAFRREYAAHKDDELHATTLLVLLSKAFILTPDGEEAGCTRFKFRPDPNFQPGTYEERVGHAMVGTVSLQQPVNRLCYMQATIASPVEFGFGLFGKIAQGGGFRLKRQQIDGKDWKSSEIHVDISGRILLLKSLAQKQDTVRTNIRVIAPHVTLRQAESMLAQPN